ncbi:MAG: methyltransferase domain-containing protein [Candidatus Komeilibacteria bacterium]|nr:methyltransferase domain-containing protein [Candidatus Komeilibacteria bacterium]
MLDFYEKTKSRPPREFVVDVLSKLPPHSLILDLGCGSGVESKVAVEMGHLVLAIDANPQAVALTAQTGAFVSQQKIESFKTHLLFDAIIAINTLQFVEPTSVSKIVKFLRPGGYLVMSVFGPQDDWVKEGKANLVASKIFGNLVIEYFNERQYAGPAIGTGIVKHWHVCDYVLKNG